jgi:hypothetical protein
MDETSKTFKNQYCGCGQKATIKITKEGKAMWFCKTHFDEYMGKIK